MRNNSLNVRHQLVAGCLEILLLCLMVLSVSSCGSSSSYVSTQKKIDDVVEKAMNDYGVPGVILGVWQKGKGQYVRSYGKARIEKDSPIPMQDGYLWRAASITKTFTANVILQLVDQQKLSLNTKLSSFEWSEGLANADQITVRMLLNHTSGYGDLENDDPAFQKIRFGDPYKVWTHEEILAWGRKMVPLSAPGTLHHYSNFGYYLLGMMIESVTHNTAAQEIQTLIADKLGLKNTRLAPMTDYLGSKPHSDGYMMADQVPPGIETPVKGKIGNTTDWNTTASWTAGGVVSDVYDMKIWIESMANGSLLSPETHKHQLDDAVPTTEDPDGPKYGLGLVMSTIQSVSLRWHNGGIPGFSSFAGSTADNSLTLVIFGNMLPAANGESAFATTLSAPIIDVVQNGE
ncbi:MAG: serine hydrolase domain-containing protein [Syntrophales bacterium]